MILHKFLFKNLFFSLFLAFPPLIFRSWWPCYFSTSTSTQTSTPLVTNVGCILSSASIKYSVCGVQIHQTGYFLHTRISTLFVAIRHLSEARPRLKCTDGTKLRCTDLVPTSSRHHLHFKWRQRRVRAFPFLPPPFTDGPQLIRDR